MQIGWFPGTIRYSSDQYSSFLVPCSTVQLPPRLCGESLAQAVTLKSCRHYSLRRFFTGFAIAAFIAWKLTVINAIAMVIKPAIANTHQLILVL